MSLERGGVGLSHRVEGVLVVPYPPVQPLPPLLRHEDVRLLPLLAHGEFLLRLLPASLLVVPQGGLLRDLLLPAFLLALIRLVPVSLLALIRLVPAPLLALVQLQLLALHRLLPHGLQPPDLRGGVRLLRQGLSGLVLPHFALLQVLVLPASLPAQVRPLLSDEPRPRRRGLLLLPAPEFAQFRQPQFVLLSLP